MMGTSWDSPILNAPMITEVMSYDYFLTKANITPCDVREGLDVMSMAHYRGSINIGI